MSGTTPRGTANEQQAAAYVRQMFGRVAPRYDLLNHLLSLNIDRYWRAQTVRELEPVLARSGAAVVDLACGTGDLTVALQQRARSRVAGTDFCHPMLTGARRKATAIPFFESDALRLPLRDSSVDAVTIAFGFRNLVNYESGLREMRRVLKPHGVAAILEFSTPPNPVFRRLYNWYSLHILPRVGAAISGAPDAYTYLPESVRNFPAAEPLAALMRSSGFQQVRYRLMTFGIVALHVGHT